MSEGAGRASCGNLYCQQCAGSEGALPWQALQPEQPTQDQLKTSQNTCSPGSYDPGRSLGWGVVGPSWQAGPLKLVAHQGDFQESPHHVATAWCLSLWPGEWALQAVGTLLGTCKAEVTGSLSNISLPSRPAKLSLKTCPEETHPSPRGCLCSAPEPEDHV